MDLALRVKVRGQGRVLEDRLVLAPRGEVVGTSPRAQVRLPLLEDLTLVRAGFRVLELCLTEAVSGQAHLGGRGQGVEAWVAGLADPSGLAVIELSPDDYASLIVGPIEVDLAFEEALTLTPAMRSEPVDSLLCLTVALALLLHGALIGLALRQGLGPPPSLADLPDRFARIILSQPSPAPLPPETGGRGEQEGRAGSPGRVRAKGLASLRPVTARLATKAQGEPAWLKGVLRPWTSGEGVGGRLDRALAGAPAGTGSGEQGSGPGSGQKGHGTGGASPKGLDKLARLPKAPARLPIISTGKARVQGGITRDQIDRVVRDHRGAIRACYERELRSNPQLAGEVRLRWTVSPQGQVTAAVVEENSTASPALASCLVSRLRRWRFPESGPGGSMAVVSYPFTFRPGR